MANLSICRASIISFGATPDQGSPQRRWWERLIIVPILQTQPEGEPRRCRDLERLGTFVAQDFDLQGTRPVG